MKAPHAYAVLFHFFVGAAVASHQNIPFLVG
jgi:hypothetical protein